MRSKLRLGATALRWWMSKAAMLWPVRWAAFSAIRSRICLWWLVIGPLTLNSSPVSGRMAARARISLELGLTSRSNDRVFSRESGSEGISSACEGGSSGLGLSVSAGISDFGIANNSRRTGLSGAVSG